MRLIQTQTRLVNQLTACLKEYYPAALHLFAKVQQRSTLVFLQTFPTPQAAQAASVEDITATLRAGKHTNPTQVAPKIFEELHRPQLVASPVMVRAKSRLMLSLVKQLLVVIEDIKSYDEAIRTLFLTHKDHELWRSLPRAGKRLAPRLLAEWGEDRTRYTDATSVQALAGTAPVPFQSGNYAKAHKRFACLKPLRNALHQFAWQSTRRKPGRWPITGANGQRARRHSMAVRALANVWVRIIYRMWVDKTNYQTATFEAAQRTCAPATRCLSRSRPFRRHASWACSALRIARQCREPVLQRSRPNGSRRVFCRPCASPAARSNVCRSPPPRSRLPVWVASQRPHRVKAAQEGGRPGAGALVLALRYAERGLLLAPKRRDHWLTALLWGEERRAGGSSSILGA